MDDLAQRALGNQNTAAANYGDKLKREQEQQSLTEPPAFIIGFEGGKYLVERLGQEPTATGVPVTNGLLQTRRRVTTTGQFVDGISRVKPVASVATPVAATGKIKYLYSIVVAGSTVFYVGGWQKKSTLVKSFGSADTVLFASLDNLGGKRWSANFSYFREGKYYVEYLSSTGENWILEAPAAAQSFGHGFWRAQTITRNDSGSTSTGTPGIGPLIQTLYSIEESDFWYAWNNKTVVQHYTTSDVYATATTTYYASGVNQSLTTSSYDRALYDLIFLPLDDNLTGKAFPYAVETNTATSASYRDGTGELVSSSSASTTTREVNTLLKVNQQGVLGVGTNNTSETGANTFTYATRYDPLGANVSAQAIALGAYYLDVAGSVITGINRSPALYTGTTDADKKVEVTFFNADFQPAKKQYAVFKPSVSGAQFMLRSTSYHPN